MSTLRIATLAVALALASTACSEQVQQATTAAQQKIEQATEHGGTVAAAMDEARRKLHEENLRLGTEGAGPRAEITPQGDLLINGVALPMTDAQREAARGYREQVIGIADTGMAMGQDGMKLAGHAVSTAVAGIFGGKAEEAGARLEAEAEKMAAAGLVLCEQVKRLEAAQAHLAALVPEFAPYAKAIEVTADCEAAAREVKAAVGADAAVAAPAATPAH